MLVGAWLLTTLCLLTGLATVAIEHAAANEFRVANVDLLRVADPVGTAPVAKPPAAHRRAVEDHPTVRYGGMSWSLTGVRLIPGADLPDGHPIVVADLVVINGTHSTVRARKGDLTLLWADGRRDPLDRFEFISSSNGFSLAPGRSTAATLVFKPDVDHDPDLAELSIEIGEPGRIPEHLPLTGSGPKPVFPITVGLPPQPVTVLGPGGLGGPGQPRSGLQITPETIRIGLDAGPFRAAVGTRLAAVEVVIADLDADLDRASATGTADRRPLQPEFWSLAAGDETVRPIRVDAVGDPRVEAVSLLFVYDADATDVTFTVAANTAAARDYSISVPGATLP